MADVKIRVLTEDEASQKLKAIDKSLEKLGGTAKTTGGGLGGLDKAFRSVTGVSLGWGAAIAGVTAGLKFTIDAAAEAERVMALTEAVIKSTGGAAGFTAEEIAKLSLEHSRLAGIEDEVVQSGNNMLLTFTAIGEEVFPRASKAMQDMAVAMNSGNLEGIDLKGTAIQLGKALNVVAGDTAGANRAMTALQRVGVRFTEDQKKLGAELIETGKVIEYQNLILGELETEFGGAAEAAGNTFTGAVQKLKNELGNLGEVAGAVAIDDLTTQIEGLTKALQAKEMEQFIKFLIEADKWSRIIKDPIRLNAELFGDEEEALRKLNEGLDEGRERFLQYIQGTEEASKSTDELAEEIEKNYEAAVKLIGSFDWAGRAAREYGIDIDKAWEATVRLERVQKGLATLNLLVSGPLGNETERFLEAERNLQERSEDLKERITELGGMEYLTPEQIAQIENTRKHLGGVTVEIKALQEALKEGEIKKKHRDDAKERIEDLKEQAGRLEEVIEGLGSTPYITTEQKKQLEEAREDMLGLTEAIQENADEHEKATKRILLDLIEQRAAQMGLFEGPQGDKARKLLDDLALKWGLIDQETFDALQTIDEALKVLGENKSVTEASNMISEIEGAAFDAGEQVDILTPKIQALMATIDDVVGEHEIHFTITQSGDTPRLMPGMNQRDLLDQFEDMETGNNSDLFLPPDDNSTPSNGGPNTPTSTNSPVINNNNYNIYNPAAMAMALDESERISNKNLRASAGVA